MKKLVMLLLIFFSLSLSLYADDFNLQVSQDNNKIILTWNNIFYGEEDEPDINSGRGISQTAPSNINEDIIQEPPKGEQPLPGTATELPKEEIIVQPETPSNAITTQAIVNQGFFSKIFNSIINTFRNIFGLKTVGVSINQYVIYKYEDSSSITGEMLYQGSLTDFNCQETCSYTYTEDYGTYAYAIVSKGSIEKESARTNAIEIKEPELRCDSLSNCQQGFICSSNGICVVEQECDETKQCSDSAKECDLTTNSCVLKVIEEPVRCETDLECKTEESCDLTTKICTPKLIEKECDEIKKCEEGKECNSENKCVDKVIICDLQGGCPPNYICKTDTNICMITNNAEQQCQNNEDCEEDKKCMEGMCKIIPKIKCETNGDINTVQTQACLFDVGICQKQGQEKKKCIQENNELKWNNFGACEPVEKCNSGTECESGICDTDIHSCLPAEFEGGEAGEISCEDNLDNDCDGVSDCEDEDCDCFIPSDNTDNLDTNLSNPNLSNSTGLSRNQNNNNLPQQQQQRNLNSGTPSRQSSNELGNERDVSGRFQDDIVGNTQSSEENGSNLLTIIITFIIVLIFGTGGIYLYLFKFKKYKKQDIIMWVEHSREMISNGKSTDDAIKEMKSQNLPEDFIKIVMKKIK